MPFPVSIATAGLSEATSLLLVQQLQAERVQSPLSPEAIATTFVRQGSGTPPLVLLHGFDSSVLEFRRLLPLLANHCDTWAIDLLGFGFTRRQPDLSYSPAAIKTHLYYTWKTLIDRPMVLVGASMGGAAAIDFALTFPTAVEKLVLIDSAGYSSGPPLGKFLISPLDRWATNYLASPRVRQSVALRAYHDPSFASLDAYHCGALHLNQPYWQQALIAFTRSGGYPSFRTQLAQIPMPTLVLWGKSDRILGTQDATRLSEAIPHSRLVWIEAAGHVPHLEKPQETTAAILDFVRCPICTPTPEARDQGV